MCPCREAREDNGKMNAHEQAAGASRKLLAALAVLAVAFVVLAAVPAVAGEGEAETSAVTYSVGGEGASDDNGDGDATPFATIAKAISYAQEKSVSVLVIEVKDDVTGNGVVVNGMDLTINYNGHKFTIDGETVGSTGTETQGFQLLQGSTVKMNGGTVFSEKAKILIQNYSDLTLTGMTLDGSKLADSVAYTLSNNNGIVDIVDTKIIAKAAGYAFDVYGLASYKSVNVTVSGTSVIDGDIEFAAANTDGHEIALTINGGTIDGVLKVRNSGKNVTATLTINGGVFKKPIENNGVINVADKGEMKADVVFGVKGASIAIAEGGSYEGNVKFAESDVVSSADVSVTAGNGGFTLAAGSIDFSGAVAETEGNVITIVSGVAVVSDDYVVPAGMVIEVRNGASLTVAEGKTLTVSENAKIDVSGTLAGDVANNGEVVIGTGADITGSAITGEGAVVSGQDPDSMKEAFLGGEVVGATFDANQKVIVDKDTTITSGDMTIKGMLVVNAGVTLTISADAHLYIENYAVAQILGNLVVEAADNDAADNQGTLSITSGIVKISGNADIRGDVDIDSLGTLEILQGSDVSMSGKIVSTGAVSIADSAVLTVSGSSTVSKYVVAGTLQFDSDVVSGSNAIFMSGNATVEIIGIVLSNAEAAQITITDAGTVEYTGASDKVGTPTAGTANTVTVKTVYRVDNGTIATGASAGSEFSGLKVVGSFEKKENADKTVTGKSVMTVTGAIGVEGIYFPAESEDEPVIGSTATVAIDGNSKGVVLDGAVVVGEGVTVEVAGTVSVSGAVDVQKNATLVNNGSMAVTGSVVSNVDDSSFTSTGTISVTGEGSIISNKKSSELGGIINAVVYETTASSKTVYNYVSIDKAIAAVNAGTTTKIEVLGEQTLMASAELPSGATMTVTGALNVGGTDGNDVVLTIASGATVKAGAVDKEQKKGLITVNGTLKALVKTDIIQSVRTAIVSDVMSEQTEDGKVVSKGWSTWTNIYTALDEAGEGDVVVLKKSIPELKTVSVKSGVTLDTNGFEIAVAKKAVLTVAGTLDLTKTGSKVSLYTGEEKDNASIVIEGYILYINDEQIAGLGIVSGAYYTLAGKDTKVLTTYANGAADALKAENYAVELKADKDKKVALGEISFVGEKDKIVKITVAAGASVTGTVSLSYADFDVAASTADAISTVDAKFVFGTDSVAVKAKVVTDLCVENAVLGEAAVLMIHGTLDDIDAKTSTSVLFDGKVYIAKNFESKADKTVVNGDLIVCGVEDISAEFTTGVLDVVGNIVIQNGSSVTVDELTVSGSVGIEKGDLEATIKATISGSVDAKAEGASADFAILYIGVDEKIAQRTTSGDASVVGNVTVSKYALVAPGATVPEAFTKEDSAYKSTVFEVEGALYLTGYAGTDCDLLIKKIDYKPTDARFDGWFVTGEDNETEKKIGEVSKVSAKIDREIYSITITTDGGIAYVTVDGVLMKNEGSNEFTIDKLVAGFHTIGISAASGYDVSNVVLKNTDGTVVGSMTVSVSGTTIDYAYQLIGSTVAVDPTPEPTPIIIKDEDDGMSLTDILLIVLVVLIVIMAAIVALRMMRS